MGQAITRPIDNMSDLVSGKLPEDLESSSFTFDKVTPKKLKLLPEDYKGLKDWPIYQQLSTRIKKDPKLFNEGDTLHFASDQENTTKAVFGHGLVGTMYAAYSWHAPLTLRPDDLWLGICTAFGNYVTNHSEKMRACFVTHQGRKELSVMVKGPLMQYSTEEYWVDFIIETEKEIAKNVKGELTEWMRPAFTTTTHRDRAVAGIILMSAMKEYFAYSWMSMCGLSKVTLEGSLTDWQALVEKAKHLYSFDQDDLSKWADLLIPVLEQFVAAYGGDVEEDFWQRIVTSKRYGSGTQEIFRGWFLVFAPFNEKGKYILNDKDTVDSTGVYGIVDEDDIVDCIVSVPVTLLDHTPETEYPHTNGKEYRVTFHGGMMMTQIRDGCVRPTVDWAMVVNKEITIEDMYGYVEKAINQYSRNAEYIKKNAPTLIPFAYYTAQEFNFPQDSLLDLADAVVSFYGSWSRNWKSPRELGTGAPLYHGFLVYLKRTDHEGRVLHKYIVKERIDEVVNGFVS